MKIKLLGAVTLAFCLFFATGATAGIVPDTSLVAPGVYFGTGNQNAGFTVLTTDGNLELGLGAIIRFVGPAPETGDTYFVFPGSTPAPNTGSVWGVTFSVNTRAGGGTLNLSDYTFLAKFTDVTENASIAIDPLQLPDNTYYSTLGVDTTPPGYFTSGFPAFRATHYGFQNSMPASAFLGFNGNVLDNYKIELSATRNGVTSTDSISVASPEPATFGLIGFVLFGLGVAGSRRLHHGK